jgi:hypothetical protein
MHKITVIQFFEVPGIARPTASQLPQIFLHLKSTDQDGRI